MNSISNNFWGPIGVAWFELRRSFTIGRMALWVLMAGFPVAMVALINWINAENRTQDQVYAIVLFALIVRVSSVMGLLLWATPIVSSEMEGKTWTYLVTRPTGSRSVVLGKYFVAVAWAISAGWVATAIAVPLSKIANSGQLFQTLMVLVVLGSLAHGALFALIGAVIQKRAMVVAFVVMVFLEGAVSMIPATFNRITVGYRLMSIFINWMEIRPPEDSPQFDLLIGTAEPSFHVMILLAYSVSLVLLAIGRVRLGGYLTAGED